MTGRTPSSPNTKLTTWKAIDETTTTGTHTEVQEESPNEREEMRLGTKKGEREVSSDAHPTHVRTKKRRGFGKKCFFTCSNMLWFSSASVWFCAAFAHGNVGGRNHKSDEKLSREETLVCLRWGGSTVRPLLVSFCLSTSFSNHRLRPRRVCF